ncbi:MAG: phosphatase PAP2 family protein [Campylobacterota bacterium]|nr:phosphatase PAP2 family protein [Campylobacterota bacterium]
MSFFYNSNDGFIYNQSWWERGLYYSVKPIIIGTMVTVLFTWFYNLYFKKNILNITSRVVIYLFLVLALAPGLIVNVIFKDNFGRARPHKTVEFGGTSTFTPAFVMSDQCERNCSFSCGHASGAFFLIAVALLASRRRRVLEASAITYGFLVGIARMANGGHFFSDVVVSFFVVYIVSHIAYHYIFKDEL